MTARRQQTRIQRRAMSLLEVLVALAIFLFTMVVIGRLIIMGGERALDVRYHSEAAQLCQAKMAEVIAGAIPLSSQSEVELEEDPTWFWSLECSSGSVTNLWNVTVRLSRQVPGAAGKVEFCALSQMVLDPGIRGSTLDSVSISGTEATTTGSQSTGAAAGGQGAQGGAQGAQGGGQGGGQGGAQGGGRGGQAGGQGGGQGGGGQGGGRGGQGGRGM